MANIIQRFVGSARAFANPALTVPFEHKEEMASDGKNKQMIKELERTLSKLDIGFRNDWRDYVENPDPILDKKDWPFYKEVARDDQVHTCETLKKVARLSPGYTIMPASDDNIDQKIAEFVEFCFNNLPGTFQKKLKDIYSAFEYGFSVTEKTYGYIDHGEWKGKVGLKYLKTRDPQYIHFRIDKHGNIEKVLQENDYGKMIELNLSDVVVYSHNTEFNNPYGRGDIMFLYKPFICKKWVMRFWSIALERFGMGLAVMSYDDGDTDQIEHIKTILRNLQARTGIAKPKSIDFTLENIQGRGNTAFENALDRYNKAIARAILVPDLLGYSERLKVGSYSLGQTHMDMFIMVLDEIGAETEETIVGEQIIKPLVDQNFPNVTDYPKFKYNPLTEDDKYKLAESVERLVGVQGIKLTPEDEKHFRTVFELPERVIEPEEEQPEQQEKTPEIVPEGGDETPAGDQDKKEIPKGEEIPSVEEPTKHEHAQVTVKPRFRAPKVVNFAQVKKDWDRFEQEGIAKLQDAMKSAKDDIFKQIERRKILSPDVNPKDIQALNVNLGAFKKELTKTMVNAYLNSKYTAMEELRKLGATMPKKFALLEDDLEPADALRFFKGKIPIRRAEIDYYIQEAFTITGVEKERVLGKAKLTIYNYMKHGDKKRATAELNKLFEGYVKTGQVKVAGGQYQLFSGYHIDTIIRTNVAEAINEGRRSMYEDPMVRDFVVGYTVSVVLDSATTDYCEGLAAEADGGYVWTKEEFEFPPYHYNCRTIPLPVVQGEEYQVGQYKPSPYEGFGF